jgi:hypothetical protein
MSQLESPDVPKTPTQKLFTVDQANKTLPLVRRIVDDIVPHFDELDELQETLNRRDKLSTKERDGIIARAESIADNINDLVEELTPIGCQLKDPKMGLVDFPALHEDRIVLLCWKRGEDEIAYWHDMESGFGGRRPVAELQAD